MRKSGKEGILIEKKSLNGLKCYGIKLDEDSYGIMYYLDNYDKRFLEVFDCLTRKLLYRITDINGDSIKYIKSLIDGAHYTTTFNNHYIIKIIKDIGYQVLYNIEMKGYLYLLHNEKILSDDNNEYFSILSLFEKDNNGIYKKTQEKQITYRRKYESYFFIQVRDNVIATKDMDFIFFYEISTLNLIKKISYYSRLNQLALLNETYLLVNSISGSANRFNLVDIDSMEIIEYFTKDEKYDLKNGTKNSFFYEYDIVDSYNLPDGSVILQMNSSYFGLSYHYIHLRWNEKEKEIYFTSQLDKYFFLEIRNKTINNFIFFKDKNLLLVSCGDDDQKIYLYYKE